MKNIGKKIIFFFMIGILVFSLSLFALVGCDMGGSATSSSSNGDTTIDNGANANQTGNKGNATAQQTDKTDASNPSADTSNNENTHSTIGGGETNSTQPGENNGNGGDIDPNNNPNEGNIGDTDNNGNATQNGADAPNGNSGNTTEENSENGNTSSGNESSGDIGNDGNTSDDPTPDDPQPEELDFSGLEAKLVEVITSQSKYNSVNKILSYSVNDGNFYVVYDYKTKRDNCIGIYSVEYSEELSTQQEIDAFDKNIKNISFDKTVFYKATSDITVDGVTYSKDGIEGDNPFARQCGVENAWMTYVSDMGGQSFSDFETGYQKLVNILIVKSEEDCKVFGYKVAVESSHEYTNEQLYKNFLTEGKNAIREQQDFELGKNLKSPEVAEASD